MAEKSICSHHVRADDGGVRSDADQDLLPAKVERAGGADAIDTVHRDATLVAITVPVHDVATHYEDDVVLATAISAVADYLVTGDRQLQLLGTIDGIVIVSPREFLDVLALVPPED
jgi:predicted nucleic acid-binding protein